MSKKDTDAKEADKATAARSMHPQTRGGKGPVRADHTIKPGDTKPPSSSPSHHMLQAQARVKSRAAMSRSLDHVLPPGGPDDPARKLGASTPPAVPSKPPHAHKMHPMSAGQKKWNQVLENKGTKKQPSRYKSNTWDTSQIIRSVGTNTPALITSPSGGHHHRRSSSQSGHRQSDMLAPVHPASPNRGHRPVVPFSPSQRGTAGASPLQPKVMADAQTQTILEDTSKKWTDLPLLVDREDYIPVEGDTGEAVAEEFFYAAYEQDGYSPMRPSPPSPLSFNTNSASPSLNDPPTGVIEIREGGGTPSLSSNSPSHADHCENGQFRPLSPPDVRSNSRNNNQRLIRQNMSPSSSGAAKGQPQSAQRGTSPVNRPRTPNENSGASNSNTRSTTLTPTELQQQQQQPRRLSKGMSPDIHPQDEVARARQLRMQRRAHIISTPAPPPVVSNAAPRTVAGAAEYTEEQKEKDKAALLAAGLSAPLPTRARTTGVLSPDKEVEELSLTRAISDGKAPVAPLNLSSAFHKLAQSPRQRESGSNSPDPNRRADLGVHSAFASRALSARSTTSSNASSHSSTSGPSIDSHVAHATHAPKAAVAPPTFPDPRLRAHGRQNSGDSSDEPTRFS